MKECLMYNLRSLWFGSRKSSERKAVPYTPARFRPQLEGFEDRMVPAAPVLNAGQEAPLVAAAAANNIVINHVHLNNFRIVNNVLIAGGNVTGTLAGLAFTTQITNFALHHIPDNPATPGVECSILHLELAPIHVSVLGLHVDTSPICLDITATEGGGLLGDLLCGLAGGGLLGTGIPTIPIGNTLTDLLGGLTDILNGVLNNRPGHPGGGGDVCTGQCDILDLVLGPVNLSLLGLNVSLDDCSGGPVEICVSATRSEGLLGSLLCGLSGSQVLGLDFGDITQLGTRATQLLADGTLSARDVGELTALLGRLIR
jgi:hypothetical protein